MKNFCEKIVISSRIRLARNVCGIPFTGKMNEEQQNALIDEVKDVFKKADGKYSYIDMEKVDRNQAGMLVEEHLISPQFASSGKGSYLILSEDKSLSVMINEEDHLRIQAMGKGLCLDRLFALTDKTDDMLETKLSFAFDEELGYLTKCPTNLGTGMRASVMIHLPALTECGRMEEVINAVTPHGFTVRGLYGEGSRANGCLYQISNQTTLGVDEKESIESLKAVIERIADFEQKIRKQLAKSDAFEDKTWRALGTLRYARSLSSVEFMKLYSDARMGAEEKITDADTEVLDGLFTEVQPYHLLEKGKRSTSERDFLRAEMVRKTV